MIDDKEINLFDMKKLSFQPFVFGLSYFGHITNARTTMHFLTTDFYGLQGILAIATAPRLLIRVRWKFEYQWLH